MCCTLFFCLFLLLFEFRFEGPFFRHFHVHARAKLWSALGPFFPMRRRCAVRGASSCVVVYSIKQVGPGG